jgi:transcriptional regulator with PAS, ATPase and Fis domain
MEWRSLIMCAVPEETRQLPPPRRPFVVDPAAQPTLSESVASGSHALHLVTIERDGPRVTTLTAGATVTVGRARECDVVLGQPSMSRRHFSVTAGAPLMLTDLGGSNGTKLNGQRLPSGTSVPFGVGELIEAAGVFFVIHDRMPHQLLGWTAGATRATGGAVRSNAEVVIADPAMRRIHDLVGLVALSTIPVIVVGETGVGKELIAAAIHDRSPRTKEPYVCLNCAALPEALLESELFGYERGAFTGASQSKRGLIEEADRGTLFLDEVGEMTLSTQAKLLRVLENGELMRVGGLKARHIDVRFVAATNRSLPTLVAEGSFRRDLYFRLNGMTIPVPPLRERTGEIAVLARFLLARSARKAGLPCPTVSEEAVERLRSHAWPGNVRELRNVMDRALTLCVTGTLRAEHIIIDRDLELLGDAERPTVTPPLSLVAPAGPSAPSAPSAPLGKPREAGRLVRMDPQAEQALIREALEKSGGNQGKAAECLGISRRTLVNRLDEYGFKRPRK